ncbi:MAG: hypothetical protein A3C06_03480 [Candidatus Taylorbacteria bacterium RIFCSPHIGHO2_02_FULL_46_13]|uniref:Uncharacterized protein n=1 Tax=Candidatus Taylorbacteria bacterium RIFCSPHIGHO2_02_FULL_46_13 TaxID=1802312 RepID=A0A1G2MUB9_9BACT|nr:MAG: hypothetical protein A3C06_03480 [Candidatus Taylorbacteria bacterium RIFCSPHIGHO2_02_FULL_46_13]
MTKKPKTQMPLWNPATKANSVLCLLPKLPQNSSEKLRRENRLLSAFTIAQISPACKKKEPVSQNNKPFVNTDSWKLTQTQAPL